MRPRLSPRQNNMTLFYSPWSSTGSARGAPYGYSETFIAADVSVNVAMSERKRQLSKKIVHFLQGLGGDADELRGVQSVG